MAWERDFQQKNLEAIRKYPVTAVARPLAARARLRLARVTRSREADALRGLQLPRRRGARRRDRPGDRRGTSAWSTSRGRPSTRSPRWRSTPKRRTLFYTTDNNAYRDLVSLDPRTGRSRLLLKDARIGDLAFNRADRSLWGIRHLNGICTLVRIPYPYTRVERRCSTFPYGTVVYDLDVSPDGRYVSASFGEISGKQDVRVLSTEDVLAGRFDAGGPVRLRRLVGAQQLRLLAGRTVPLRELLLHGRVEHLPVRARDQEPRGGEQRGDRASSARSRSGGRTGRFPLHRPGLRAHAIHRAAAAGRQRDHVPRRAGRREAPVAQVLDDRVARGDSLRHDAPPRRPVPPGRRPGARVGLPGRPGLQGHGGRRVRGSTSPTRSSSTGSPWPRPTRPTGDIADSERVHLRADYQRYDWHARASWNDADFYDLFGPTQVGRKGYDLRSRPSQHAGLRRAAARGPRDRAADTRATSIGCRTTRTSRSTSPGCSPSTRALYGSDVRSSLGHVDDEKGTKWELVGRVDQRRRQDHPEDPRRLGRGIRPCRSATRRSGCATPPASPPPTAPTRSPTSTSAAFGNNYVDHGDEKRYRDVLRASRACHQRDRRAQLRALTARVERCRRCASRAPARRASTSPGRGRRSSSRVSARTSTRTDGAARRTADVGAQLDFRFTVLSDARHDALGRRRRRAFDEPARRAAKRWSRSRS